MIAYVDSSVLLRLALGQPNADVGHWNLRAPILMSEELAQMPKLVERGSPRTLTRLADEAQLAAGVACFLDGIGSYRKVSDGLCGTQDNADPHQIIDDRGGPGPIGPPCPHVFDQNGRREIEDVGFADGVASEEFHMALLAPLPLRDRLEGLDVPSNELGQRNRFAPVLPNRSRAFELDPRGAWPRTALRSGV
jgi:hypothetical protein